MGFIPRFIRRLFRKPIDGLRQFRAVEEGVLYRCGQPAPEDVRTVIESHGIRTVVSLRGMRGEEDSDAWEPAERAICEQLGVRFITLPSNHRNPPTREQLEQFLSLVRDPASRPVLVHCRLGRQRTGMFCGLYRVFEQGWTAEAALEEMDALGFNSGHRRHQMLLQAFRELAQGRSANGKG
ncbi:MAG: protein phosphatase [Planctomycetota bacterium]